MSENKPETASQRPEPPKLPDKPAPGPGVTGWLSSLLGPQTPALRESSAPETGGQGTVLRLPVELPESLFDSADGVLRRLGTRSLPDGVRLSAGRREADGHWVLAPNQVAGLQALVDDPSRLPIAMTFRAEFASADGSGTWTEMMGAIIDATTDTATASVPAAPAVPDKADILTAIDLDVSLGIDDPATVAGVVLVFSGLPQGAALSAGEAGADGAWHVPAPELDGLAVLVPEGAAPFDLKVSVDNDPEEAASFQVELPADPTPIVLRLGPPSPAMELRFKIFADGAQIADRLVRWSPTADLPIALAVPYGADNELPFELVVRYAPVEAQPLEGPAFLGAEIGAGSIQPDGPGVTARGPVTDAGRRWSGDLVIDVRQAGNATPAHPVVEDEPPLPPKPAPPHQVAEAADDIAETAPLPEPEPEPAPEPDAESDEPPTLVIRTSADDIRRPAFIQELERLGRFIREPTGEVDHRLYDRLGIDVGRWHDIAIYGPVGEPVETAPMLPTLAPPGGRDNARGFSHLDRWYTPPPGVPAVMVEGLPPGSMLSHGVNLGDGRWRVAASDIPNVSVVGPVGEQTTVPATIVEIDENDLPLEEGVHALLMGTIADTLRPEVLGLRLMTYPLTAEVFDPDGHGTLSLTVGDMPPGSLVCGATNHGGGVWTLDSRSGNDLAIMASAQSGPFSFTVTCIALDTASGSSSVVTRTLSVVPRLGAIDGAAA